MSLHVKSNEVPEYNRVQSGEAGTGAMTVRKGYGNECSLMIATRRPRVEKKCPNRPSGSPFVRRRGWRGW